MDQLVVRLSYPKPTDATKCMRIKEGAVQTLGLLVVKMLQPPIMGLI